MDARRRSSLKTTALNFICLSLAALALNGCSSLSTHSDEPIPPDATQKKLDEQKALLGSLNSRVESLEGRLKTMTAKFETTQTSLDTFLKNETGAPVHAVPVYRHASETVGASVPVPATAKDPQAGFVNDQAIHLYRKAMIYFEARKYPESVVAFSAFLEKNPDHVLAGSAQYYVGESYYRQKEYKLADQEFERVLTSYDRSSHVSETLRDLADTEDHLNKKEDAARHRQLLSSLFPQSPANGTSAAKSADSMENSDASSIPPTSAVTELNPPATAPAVPPTANSAPVKIETAPPVVSPQTSAPSIAPTANTSSANVPPAASTLDEPPSPTPAPPQTPYNGSAKQTYPSKDANESLNKSQAEQPE